MYVWVCMSKCLSDMYKYICVYMYMYVYICVYIYIYVCIHTYVYACKGVCMCGPSLSGPKFCDLFLHTKVWEKKKKRKRRRIIFRVLYVCVPERKATVGKYLPTSFPGEFGLCDYRGLHILLNQCE